MNIATQARSQPEQLTGIRVIHKTATGLATGLLRESEGTDAMLAMFCTLVFASAATLAIAVLAASWRRHGAQALAIIRAARTVADVREFEVRITAPASGRPVPAAVAAQRRRQPRPAIIRPALRPVEARRAAA